MFPTPGQEGKKSTTHGSLFFSMLKWSSEPKNVHLCLLLLVWKHFKEAGVSGSRPPICLPRGLEFKRVVLKQQISSYNEVVLLLIDSLSVSLCLSFTSQSSPFPFTSAELPFTSGSDIVRYKLFYISNFIPVHFNVYKVTLHFVSPKWQQDIVLFNTTQTHILIYKLIWFRF